MTGYMTRYNVINFYITCMELFQNKLLPGQRNGNEVSPEQLTKTRAMIHLVQSAPATDIPVFPRVRWLAHNRCCGKIRCN